MNLNPFAARRRPHAPSPALSVVQDRLLAELHRRTLRYESGAITDPAVQENVRGELVGLRVAVGVAHGYEAATPQCPQEADRLYAAWRALQDAKAGARR